MNFIDGLKSAYAGIANRIASEVERRDRDNVQRIQRARSYGAEIDRIRAVRRARDAR